MDVKIISFTGKFRNRDGEEVSQTIYAYNKSDAIKGFRNYALHHDMTLIEESVKFTPIKGCDGTCSMEDL